LFKAASLLKEDCTQAYVQCRASLKYDYQEPRIWQMLGKIYEHNGEYDQSLVCMMKSAKYGLRLGRIG
jgi:cytochrome c-type biogenesis protein CcmH/NrfG